MTPTHIHNPTGDNDGVQIEDKDTQGSPGRLHLTGGSCMAGQEDVSCRKRSTREHPQYPCYYRESEE